jgi:hypothetical protein
LIVEPFTTFIFARMGHGIDTNEFFKMVACAVNSGSLSPISFLRGFLDFLTQRPLI